MKRLVIALCVASLGLAACSSARPHASAPLSPTSTTVAKPADPYAIPAVITPAYVDSVFAALNHVNGDASRLLVADRTVNKGVTSILRSIYNDPLYAEQVKIAGQSLQGNLSDVRHPVGDIRTVVAQLISGSGSCIFVRTRSDYAAVVTNPGPPAGSEYFELRPTQVGDNSTSINPTPWSMAFNAVYMTPTPIPNQCAT
jgi:hypothetical protein